MLIGIEKIYMSNKKTFSINYLGESVSFLESLKNDKRFTIQNVFCENKRLNNNLIHSASNLLCPIEGKNDLEEKITKRLSKVDFNIIYSFPIIIPPSLIEVTDFYNIHPGSLYDNRGRNPIVWSLILGDDKTVITLHKITKEIDCGVVISEQEVLIDEDEKFSTLKYKLESKFKNMLNDLYNFIISDNINYKTIQDGIYRKKITEADITIDIQNDSSKIIKRKINSQDVYNGALLVANNQTYRVGSIISEQNVINSSKSPKIDFDNDTIKIYTKDKLLEVKYRRI